MIHGLSIQGTHEDADCDAYNAAFYELGFRWHWDSDIYSALLKHSDNAAERVLHYLQKHQPHLLRAYDSSFLIEIIEEKKAHYLGQSSASSQFDWAQNLGREIGA